MAGETPIYHKLSPIIFPSDLKYTNKISQVGTELEGVWDKFPPGLTKSDFVREGSLDDTLRPLYPNAAVVDELPSPPLTIDAMELWLRSNWPDHIDASCGFHIHVSFKNPFIYSRAVKREYTGTIVHYLREWAKREKLDPSNPIWDRLDGKSIYCQHAWFGDLQIENLQKDRNKTRIGHRYTINNYLFGRGIPTVETRVLPMFQDVEQGILAMREVIDITNKFLAATAKFKRRHRAGVRLDNNNTGRNDRRVILV